MTNSDPGFHRIPMSPPLTVLAMMLFWWRVRTRLGPDADMTLGYTMVRGAAGVFFNLLQGCIVYTLKCYLQGCKKA